ncbi:LuxR C-terminal-related transcriptional regulator [Lentzea sp. NPDC060358]|uniref:helix-turn-helix transcriptional regulator n=1 Tax=Lentzea sp. NPDC060358 TaxID=3347103 RepID=UPI00364DEA9A
MTPLIFHVPGPLEAHAATGAVVDLGTPGTRTAPGKPLLHLNASAGTGELVRATWPEPAAPVRRSARRRENSVKTLSLVRSGSPAVVGLEARLAAAGEVLIARSAAGCSLPIRQVDHDNLRRGVRYRVLVPDRARTAPGLAARLGALALAGADIRSAPKVPLDAVVVDRVLTVLPAGRRDAVAAFELASVVTTAVELFERVWQAAVPFTAAVAPAGEVTDRERELLTLLFEGSTDEAAAARLNISVRTVRRTVSQLMDRLGARSRFQAGAKAADRGWLLGRAG